MYSHKSLRKHLYLKEMNIHQPKYLTWWEGKAHQSAASGYNAEWQSFFEANQGAAKTQILEEGKGAIRLISSSQAENLSIAPEEALSSKDNLDELKRIAEKGL